MNPLPVSIDPPLAVIIMNRAPGRKIMWQQAPGAPSAVQVQDGVHHFTHINYERTSAGHKVLCGHFPEVRFEGRKFPVVVMLDVLEHLADPLATLRAVKVCLGPTGVLVLNVPSSDGLIFQTAYFLYTVTRTKCAFPLERLFQSQFPYPHLFYYSPATLRALLVKAGFQPFAEMREAIVDPGDVKARIAYSRKKGKSLSLKDMLTIGGLKFLALATEVTGRFDKLTVFMRPRPISLPVREV